jgi:hypothetical protein
LTTQKLHKVERTQAHTDRMILNWIGDLCAFLPSIAFWGAVLSPTQVLFGALPQAPRAASFAARPAKKPTVGFFDGARFVFLTSKEVKIAAFCRKTKPAEPAYQMRFRI